MINYIIFKIGNPITCKKCNQLPLISMSQTNQSNIDFKCLCGNKWTTNLFDIFGIGKLLTTDPELKNWFMKKPEKTKHEVRDKILEQWRNFIELNFLTKFPVKIIKKCEVHNTNSIEYFCIDCIKHICQGCLNQDHKTHKTVLIKNMLNVSYLKDISEGDKYFNFLLKYNCDLHKEIEQEIKDNYSLVLNDVEKIQIDTQKKLASEYALESNLYNKCLYNLYKILVLIYLVYGTYSCNYVLIQNMLNFSNFYIKEFEYKERYIFKSDFEYYYSLLTSLVLFYSSYYFIGIGPQIDKENIIRNITSPVFKIKNLVEVNQRHYCEKNLSIKVTYILLIPKINIFLVCSSEGTMSIIHPNTLENAFQIEAHKDRINCACLLRDKCRILTCSDDKTIKKWSIDLSKFKKPLNIIQTLSDHSARVKQIINMDYCHDSRFASFSEDNSIIIWIDSFQGGLITKYKVLQQENEIKSIIQIYDGRLCTATSDDVIKFWDMDEYKLMEDKNISNVNCAHITSLKLFTTKFLLIGGNTQIVVYDLVTEEICQKIEDADLCNISCFINLFDDAFICFGRGCFCQYTLSGDEFKLYYKLITGKENIISVASYLDRNINIEMEDNTEEENSANKFFNKIFPKEEECSIESLVLTSHSDGLMTSYELNIKNINHDNVNEYCKIFGVNEIDYNLDIDMEGIESE